MRGLTRRKGSEVWQGRLYIPSKIWKQRERLLAVGQKIPKVQTWTASTGERDERAAERVYLSMRSDHDLKVDAWEALLKELDRLEERTAHPLTHAEKAGLVRGFMADFLARHRAGPAKMPPAIPEYGKQEWLEYETAKEQLSISEGRKLDEWLIRCASDDPKVNRAAFHEVRTAYANGESWAFMMGFAWSDLLKTPEAMTVAKGLRKNNILLPDDDESAKFFLDGVGNVRRVRSALEATTAFNYLPVREVEARIEALPEFAAEESPLAHEHRSSGRVVQDLFELLAHKVVTQNKRPATRTAYEGSLKRLVKFLGHSDARLITKKDVLDWRDSMRNEGLDTATINKKHLAALKAVLEWGTVEGALTENVAASVLDRTVREPVRVVKGHSREQVTSILRATFESGSWKPGLSTPYRRALFWLPWLLAYTGLRPIEVAQLRAEDVKQKGGVPFLFITPEAGSTKGNNSWITGVHQHLVELGFVEMALRVSSGPLFYSAYAAGTDLRKIKSPRSIEAYSEVSDWIRDRLGLDAPRGRRLHAFRHAMTTSSRGGGDGENAWNNLNKEARDYMLGSRAKSDARESYGEWPPEVVDREINKLPRFEVSDTGWRPD